MAFLRKSGCRNAARCFAEFHRQIVQQKCVSPDFRNLRILSRRKRGHIYGTQHTISGDRARRAAHARYAIPCVISLLVGALYNIVDQIFIANASYLGSYGNAANTVVFPLTVVALAIAVSTGKAILLQWTKRR